jgi:hypothetical protein
MWCLGGVVVVRPLIKASPTPESFHLITDPR